MIFQETENQKGATNHEVGLIALWHRSRPINLITGPIIYSMVVPLLFLDICVSVYQACCFPVYRVAQVSRRDFIFLIASSSNTWTGCPNFIAPIVLMPSASLLLSRQSSAGPRRIFVPSNT